jgi:hypothetical protein
MNDNGGLKGVETENACVSKDTSSILKTLPHNE